MALSSDDVSTAMARGGPLDGSVLGEAGPEEFEVVMADGSCHVYVVTDEWGESAPRIRARVYSWRGRRGGGPHAGTDQPQRF